MAIPWLAALKVIPWGDVIEHAPKVLDSARSLLERQRTPKTAQDAADGTFDATPEAPAPSLADLQHRLSTAQLHLQQQSQALDQLTETLTELAEQNARLVGTVDVLRQRTRLLLWAGTLLVMVVAWLALR